MKLRKATKHGVAVMQHTTNTGDVLEFWKYPGELHISFNGSAAICAKGKSLKKLIQWLSSNGEDAK